MLRDCWNEGVGVSLSSEFWSERSSRDWDGGAAAFRCDRAQGAAMRGTSDVRWRSGSVQGGQGAEGQGLEGHTFVEIARI